MAAFGVDLSPEDQEKSNALQQEIMGLLHAVQSGIAQKISYDDHCVRPKHLRVGIDNALVEHGALVELLVRKNIFTELEYFEAYRNALKKEVADREKELTAHYGLPVTLA